MFSDLRYALRVLSKSRSFTAIVVFALAIGIGANTAIFSMADAIVFHPYPFPQLDRIVALSANIPAVNQARYGVSSAEYYDWKQQNHAFDEMAAYKAWAAILNTPDGPQRVSAYAVSSGFFPLLRTGPVIGRGFSSENARNEVLVGYGFWEQRLGRDPGVLDRRLNLNGLDYVVVGVMGSDVDLPMYTDIWTPWIDTPEAHHDRTSRDFQVIARLKPGVALAQARSEMDGIGSRLARQYPQTNAGRSVSVMLLRDTIDEYADRFMAVVTCAVLFLLLLACANVANLQLARGASRRNEMAMRMALGASRLRIVRQLVLEGTVLSVAGAVLGLPLAVWGLTVIKANLPEMVCRHLPGMMYAHLDQTMLVYTLAAALATGVAFTIPAAAQACSERLHETLKSGGRSVSSGRVWMRSALVVSEIMFAIALLIGAGLMVKGFRGLASLNQGFDAADVLTFRMGLPASQHRSGAPIVNFYRELLRRLNGAALVSNLPALAESWSNAILIESQPPSPPERPLLAEVRVISEDYFLTLAIPVRKGRSFSSADSEGTMPVAIVSQSAARRFWPKQDPIGERVKMTSHDLATSWLTVVGVAGDVNHFFLDSAVRPTIYVPYTQQPVRSFNVLFRPGPSLDRTVTEARAVVHALDATQAVPNIQRLSRYFADLAGGVGVIASLMAVFAVIALIMAAAGIYAVVSYSVAQRIREIGIRMALGARPRDVLRLILGNLLRLAAIGLGIGCCLAFALTRAMSKSLPGLVALDSFTFASFAVLLTAVALLAGWLPSRRAAKVDPLLAMRSE
ncbi:MAG TPA: ABC transporter permease [Bryobacteraceae bacterium]|nr:ABC transporter permease [Bryobacteraceae bacterium]